MVGPGRAQKSRARLVQTLELEFWREREGQSFRWKQLQVQEIPGPARQKLWPMTLARLALNEAEVPDHCQTLYWTMTWGLQCETASAYSLVLTV